MVWSSIHALLYSMVTSAWQCTSDCSGFSALASTVSSYVHALTLRPHTGIQQLHDAIIEVALNARDPDTKEKIIGQQVPASYIGLHRVIEEEVAKRRLESTPPVLTQQEFTKLTDKIPDNDILDDEDLALGWFGQVGVWCALN